MNAREFASLVEAFRTRAVVPPEGQRHLYLWHGDRATLVSVLGRAQVLQLNLHDLSASLVRKPSDLKAARRLLEEAIGLWFRYNPQTGNDGQVVLVEGCDLLMRYQVPAAAFVQAANDRRMIVFAVAQFCTPASPLPSYVQFKVSGTYEYLSRYVPAACIVE